ncbi:hypothetical protein KCP69_25540 [Salmonella enterica subsp. enterica]|nr:hypothetical protein KCP69_25540 [Salmonella enterica subsp. enterica]
MCARQKRDGKIISPRLFNCNELLLRGKSDTDYHRSGYYVGDDTFGNRKPAKSGCNDHEITVVSRLMIDGSVRGRSPLREE